MSNFRDNKGRVWRLEATDATVRNALVDTGVDLVGAMSGESNWHLQQIMTNPRAVQGIAYALAERFATAHGVDYDDFIGAIWGGALLDAGYAILSAATDYAIINPLRETP